MGWVKGLTVKIISESFLNVGVFDSDKKKVPCALNLLSKEKTSTRLAFKLVSRKADVRQPILRIQSLCTVE